MAVETRALWLSPRSDVIAAEDPSVWRAGAPDYSLTVDRLAQERQVNFPEGSLEDSVTNLVRVFEMEATYKADARTWISIDPDVFTMRTNGGPAVTAHDVTTQGAYNLFLGDRPDYRGSKHTFDSSEAVFHQAFPEGFLWELMTLTVALPIATLQWRHWGRMSGTFGDVEGDGGMFEMFGTSVVTLNDDLKIVSSEHYFDAGSMFDQLTGRCPMAH
ncbi:SnoaL-like polyketide cyclase [Rhodococcus erythropolis]|uniref:SnoaL-like polyketide cyclase n=1 Tax=Rhodococcus erythropolis TaxID=1833 RepID=UPI002948DBCB|nr:SnoaL-like polyketide cyclase [Rhodococcus erythropolis]MDV6277054.1 SnoaL-like polyketide cyclase [Rhodococcus erythropolis]